MTTANESTPPQGQHQGALSGYRVIEFAGLGPAPMAGMLLADMGADVIVIDRPPKAQASDWPSPTTHRNKRWITLDLKDPTDIDVVWKLLDSADALIEGFRPGVMERLGLSPQAVAERCPKLVYGRVTGWGQQGPLAHAAGHDINYLALTGVLSVASHPGETPMVPATMIGDMGGGALYLAFGVVCALLETQRSGQGQVVDAAMVDGVASMAALVQAMRSTRRWSDEPSRNFFLGTSAFYDAFECADGRHITFGAIEPAFYGELLTRLGLTDVSPLAQHHHAEWPALRARVAALVRSQPLVHWCSLLEGTDACVSPVLNFEESLNHPHMQARGTWVRVGDAVQPAVAPRLSRTPGATPSPVPNQGEHTQAVLKELGINR